MLKNMVCHGKSKTNKSVNVKMRLVSIAKLQLPNKAILVVIENNRE